jgi:glycosyltransferase involved in cell wall biosynthesis
MTLHGLLMFLSVLPAIKKLQKDFDFDLIDAHYVYPDGFAAVLLGQLFKKPVIVSARGSDINLFKEFSHIRRLLRYTLSKADGRIAVCQALGEAIVDLGIPQEEVTVIPNGVDTNKFYPLPKKNVREKLNLPNGKVLLSVGNLIPRKGFDLLLKALRLLLIEHQEKDLYLVIVGEGPARSDLEHMIASYNLGEHVRLAGDIPHENLCLWYSAADLFCLASSREGWPNVLLESLACGTPVVATAVWGTPEIIRSDKLGFLTERNERALAETISLALNKTWQSDALVRYAQEHTWERVAQSILRLFDSFLDDRRISPCGQTADAQTSSHIGVYTEPP